MSCLMDSRVTVCSRKERIGRLLNVFTAFLHPRLPPSAPASPVPTTKPLWHPLACQRHHARLHQRLLQPCMRCIAAAGAAQQLHPLPTTPHRRLAAAAPRQRPTPQPAAAAASGRSPRWVGGAGLGRGWEEQVDDWVPPAPSRTPPRREAHHRLPPRPLRAGSGAAVYAAATDTLELTEENVETVLDEVRGPWAVTGEGGRQAGVPCGGSPVGLLPARQQLGRHLPEHLSCLMNILRLTCPPCFLPLPPLPPSRHTTPRTPHTCRCAPT